jgi:colanic acid biosynthesis glycosyl transferase WcaI
MGHQKNKILVVCQHFWPENFRINDICEYFIESNCDVEVLCGLPNYPSGKFPAGYGYFKNRKQTHNGINVRRSLEIPRGKNTNLRILINYLSFPFFSLFHIPRLLTNNYDKIFLYQLSPVMMSVAGIIVGKIKRIETTMYVLDLWPENLFSVVDIKQPLFKKAITRISHWHYRHVDKIIVLSKRMKDRIIEVTDISEDRIIVLPQACEKIYEIEQHDMSLQKRFAGKFNILYTGNISPAQSFNTMIAAAELLKKRGHNNINWIIVGDGMSRKDAEVMVTNAGLADIFHFEGQKPVEDIPKYTAFADVLVGCLVKSNLLEATIPAKVMSYIAAGRPVVLAMDGEVQNLINDTIRCGFAGPTSDAKTLSTNIEKIIFASTQEKKKMGDNAKNYHFKHFERNIVLERLYSFIFNRN